MGISFDVPVGGKWDAGETSDLGNIKGPFQKKVLFSDSITTSNGTTVTFNYVQDPSHPALVPPVQSPKADLPPSSGGGQSQLQFQLDYFDKLLNTFGEVLDGLSKPLKPEDLLTLIQGYLDGGSIPDNPELNSVLQEVQQRVGEWIQDDTPFPTAQEQGQSLGALGGKFVGQSQGDLGDLQQYAATLPEGEEKSRLQSYVTAANAELGQINQTLSDLGNVASREEFDALSSKLNEQIKGLKDNLGAINDQISDPYVGAIVGHIQSEIKSAANVVAEAVAEGARVSQLAGGNTSSLSKDVQDIYSETMESSYNASFEKHLTNLAESNGWDASKVAQLRFAHFNPESATASIQADLQLVESSALNEVSSKWGVPADTPPKVDNSVFNATVINAYDDAFDEALQGTNLSAVANELGISEENAAGLISFLHHNPGAEFSGSTQLQGVVNEINTKALRSLSGEMGVPEGHPVESGDFAYNASLQGNFSRILNDNIAMHEPPLTPGQITAVRAALANPLDPGVTPATKQLIGQLYNESVAALKDEFNLPDNWSPPTTLLNSVVNVPFNIRAGWATINQVDSALKVKAAEINSMGQSPEKASLLNTLKIISQALSKLKEALARFQILDAEMASKVSEAQKDASLEKIRTQIKKTEAAAKKKRKMAPFKTFMKIFSVIMSVFTAGLMGPLGAAMFASTASSAAGGQDFMQHGIEKLEKAIVSTLKPLLGDKAANAIGVLFTMMIMNTVSGGMGAYKYMTDYGGFERFLAKGCGAKPMVASIVSMAVGMAVEIVAMVVMTILSGGASAALLVGYITAKVAQVVAKVAQAVIKVLTKIAEIAAKISQKIVDALIKTINKVINFAQKMTKLADEMLAQLKVIEQAQKAATAAVKVEKQVQSAVKAGEDIASNVITHAAEQVGRTAKAVDEAIGVLQSQMRLLSRFIQAESIVSEVIEMTVNIQNVVHEVSMGKLAKEIGKYDAEIAILEGLIAGLKKILQTLMEAMESSGQHMTDIGQLQSKLAADRSQTLDAIVQA